MNAAAHDRAESAACWIAYHAKAATQSCLNLNFWMPRIGDIPAFETACEAELAVAESSLLSALDDVRKARAAFAAGRTPALIAAE